MDKSSNQRESKRLQEVAKEYKDKGYEVIVQPSPEQLPPFLSGYSPDVIARGDDETVIIEVKTKSSLSNSDYFSSMARRLQEHPKYRFELVVTNPRNAGSLKAHRLLDEKDISKRVLQVRALKAKENYEAALLLAWATAEGTLRLLAKRENVTLNQLSPSFVIKHLTSLGLIVKSDYETLRKGMQLRNTIVHGFKTSRLGPKDIDALLNVIKKIDLESAV